MKYSIYFYFYIFFQLMVNCANECDGCKVVNNICTHNNEFLQTCNSQCRPNSSVSPPNCVFCKDIKEGDKYYINSNVCTTNISSHCKVMDFNSKQCLDNCGSLKRMGDFCYSDCTTGNRKSKGDYECECNSFFYKSYEEDKLLIQCIGSCESFHKTYNAETLECFSSDSCDQTGWKKTYQERGDKSGIYKCSKNCDANKKIYGEYCVDNCPTEKPYYYVENGLEICIDNCTNKGYYYGTTKKCETSCTNFISDDSHCLSSCNPPYYRYTDNLGRSRCSVNCPGGMYKEVEPSSNNICVYQCATQLYTQNNYCITEADKNKCFYRKDTSELNQKCLTSCSETLDSFFYKYNEKECTTHYQTGYCHINGQYELFPIDGTAPDMPTGSFYTKDSGDLCYCILFGFDENNKKKCYKDEKACKAKNYLFLKGTECLRACKPYFEVVDDFNKNLYLRKCFNSIDECKSEGYLYYNVDMLTCWNNCPQGMYSIEVDKEGKPQRDKTGSTCVVSCGQDFPKHTKDMMVCKKKCDDNEFFKLEEPNICLSTCKDAYPGGTAYVGENNECLKECGFNKYILEITNILGQKELKCVSRCSDYGKFYVNNQTKCFDNCLQAGNYHHYNSDNRCLTSCLFNDLDEKFSIEITGNNQIERCRETNEDKYYYEEDKILLNTKCPLLYSVNSFKCLYNCDGGKVLPNDVCTTACPSEYPYYNNESKTINSKTIYINKCLSQCPEYSLIYSKKCIKNCPNDYSFNNKKICYPNCNHLQKFNLKNGQCEYECPGDKYYEKTTEYGTPDIYVCKDLCLGSKKFIKDEEDPECVTQCPQKNNYILNGNKCKPSCNTAYPYYKELPRASGSTYPIYECLKFCPLEDGYKYVKYDNSYDSIKNKGQCLLACPDTFNFIIEGILNECLSSCPTGYFFDLSNAASPICKKYNFCVQNTNQKKYYFNGTCYDLNGCKTLKKFFVEDYKCVDECKINIYKKKTSVTDVFECTYKCGENEFIDSRNYCVDECPERENFIGKDKKCKAQCDESEGFYHYYEFKKSRDNKYSIYKCIEKCSNSTYYLEGFETKQCFKECPRHLPLLSINENKCYNNCLSSPQYTFTQGSDCKASCDINHRYYYDRNQTCLSRCNPGDFAEGISINNYIYKCVKNCNFAAGYYSYTNSSTTQNKFCFKECPKDKPYAENYTCVKHCTNEKRFFVKEFKHYEENLQKICLTDCPQEYPYFTLYKDGDGIDTYGCINTCNEGFKVLNYSDRHITATLCMKNCPPISGQPEYSQYKDYKYQIIDNNNKTCYSICPPEKPYHKDISLSKYSHDSNCYAKCPEETPFTDINQIVCKSETDCSGDYIDYENLHCLPSVQRPCPKIRKYYSLFENKYICLDRCIEKYGKYLTPNGTCVKDCESKTDPLVKDYGLINDPKTDNCICKHLYVINDNLKMECLQNSTSETKCKNVSSIYSIKMFNSKECVKACINNNILSATEDICYSSSHHCNQDDLPDDRNTELITKKNGQRKCECKYKFYFKLDEDYPNASFKKKVCLDEDGLCPTEYRKYIPDTKECYETDKDCPDEFSCLFLGIFCLRNCPRNSTYNNTEKYHQCNKPNEYWHETTNGSGNYECLDKCLDKYPVYAPSTNQCLTKCTGSIYPYFYENKCYNSCNNSKLLNIENGFITESKTQYSNFICDCHNPWFYNDEHKKVCADSMIEYSILDCNNFTDPNPNPVLDHLVRRTLQCVDKCPKEFNYTFNKECFENCKEAAYYYHYVTEKKNSYECICENLWFYEPNNKKQCLDPNVTECVVYDYEQKFYDKKYFDKKYLVNETNECVNKCPKGLYSFNYVCYDKCPINTEDVKLLDEPIETFCKCNREVGYWYEYERYNLTYLECGVEKCPLNNDNSSYIRSNLLEEENKCLITCRENEDFPFSLRKVCVKECPFFTYTNDKEDELNDTCIFFDLNDERVDTLEKFKAAANIQAMELYEKSEKLGGFLFNKLNTSLQIYSVDNNDSLKELYFKSNLTYINFGTCLDKLMIDKNISENESILITKYDILPGANKNVPQDTSVNHIEDKYLINPVEYELYSSLTNEKLDAFVCEPYEILISYPLCLSKFDKYIDNVNQNEYRKKFDMGKELYHKDNTIDTFNYNNTIYTHFCKELEINGKDLVFEDRYKNLYPNNKLLCESNCTYNNTDFDLERVNCNCTYKDVFDFNRKEGEINDILNNPDFYLPTQSSTNAEIIKCLFNFTLKQAIIKNEMFYCCSIMTLAQIVLVLISSCVSIKNMINDIRHILNKVNIKNYFLKKNKLKMNMFNNNNIISSTNRELNNPPKKNKDNEDNDIEKIDEEFNNTILEKDSDTNNSKGNKDNEIILDQNKIYSSTNNKAEYIPPDFNFKFFKPKDKGVMKKIDRSEIPFDINPDTKYLIERREGIDYAEDYLNGPYLKNQNILVIVNAKINKENKSRKININNTLSLNNFINDDNLKDNKVENKSKIRNTKLYDSKYINEKNFVTIKPGKSNLKSKIKENFEFNPENELKLNDEGNGFFESIKREQIFLRINYDKYLQKKHTNVYNVYLAEIFDKIYFIKICLFLKKFDIFWVQLSLYIFYHIILISLLCGFFTIKIIKKIWEQDNFPDINFYLLYGFIAHIIIWVIYQMFLCVLDFHGKIKDMITLKYELIENQYTEEFDRDNIHDSNEGIYKEKYDELIYQIKCRIAIYFVLAFIFSLFFTVYLISFFSFYTGTKNRVLEAYFISIIEILLIKICYGILLASLRLLSERKRIKTIYNIVYFFDKHIS